jgi:hypothetical protein
MQTGAELRVSGGSSATYFGQDFQRTGSLFIGAGTKNCEGGLSMGASPGLGGRCRGRQLRRRPALPG